MLQFAAFVDAGYVWNRGAVIDSTGKTETVNLRDVKFTPGMGLRYLSKVGPIRVDFAYNGYGTGYGAAYYTDANQVLHCVSPDNAINQGIPTAGQTCPTSFKPAVSPGFFQRLTFNFSIGQSF
jgi:outer membrane protein assembly factor BamA